MKIFNSISNWLKEHRLKYKLRYHSLGCFYFVFWWIVFFLVLILFTGGWYDEFYKQCKSESFNGLTMFLMFVSGITAFIITRGKIIERIENEAEK